MFGFFTKDNSVLILPVYRNGNSLAFTSGSPLELKQGVAVRDSTGRRAQVEVQKRRRLDEATWLYFADLVHGDLDTQEGDPELQLRRDPRFPVGVRVRSGGLPDYMALTEDLSVGGAQLQVLGPVRVGEELELEIDLDGAVAPVRALARVCWSRMSSPWRAGLSFLRFEGDGAAALARFLSDPCGFERVEAPTPGAKAPDGSMLRRHAYLHSSYEDGDAVILKLITEDEVMELRFSRPTVLSADLATQMVGNIVTQPGGEGLIQTHLLDPAGHTLLAIESPPPDIVCRGLRAADFD